MISKQKLHSRSGAYNRMNKLKIQCHEFEKWRRIINDAYFFNVDQMSNKFVISDSLNLLLIDDSYCHLIWRVIFNAVEYCAVNGATSKYCIS